MTNYSIFSLTDCNNCTHQRIQHSNGKCMIGVIIGNPCPCVGFSI